MAGGSEFFSGLLGQGISCRWTRVIILVVIIGISINNNARAAVFRVAGICATSVSFPCDSPDLTVFIIGAIEAGDTDRLKDILRQYGPAIRTVTLRSEGGSVAEGIKIGRLLRSLYIGTSAPFADVKTAACRKESAVLGVTVSCTCASACFFIFVGGVNRWGTDILIHRIVLMRTFSEGWISRVLRKCTEQEWNVFVTTCLRWASQITSI